MIKGRKRRKRWIMGIHARKEHPILKKRGTRNEAGKWKSMQF